jgi:hypothetical protein
VSDRTGFRAPAVCGAVVALGAWSVFWWLAVPRHEICAMTYPAPAGCGSARVPVATFWSAVTAGSYGVMLLLGARRYEHGWWVVGLLGLIVGSVWGFFSVLYT